MDTKIKVLDTSLDLLENFGEGMTLVKKGNDEKETVTTIKVDKVDKVDKEVNNENDKQNPNSNNDNHFDSNNCIENNKYGFKRSLSAFAKLNKAINSTEPIVKDSKNSYERYSYLSLPTIWKHFLKALDKEKINIIVEFSEQNVNLENNTVSCIAQTIIMSFDDETYYDFPKRYFIHKLITDSNGKVKQLIKDQGALATYAEKYSLMNIFKIGSGEDPDSQPSSQKQPYSQKLSQKEIDDKLKPKIKAYGLDIKKLEPYVLKYGINKTLIKIEEDRTFFQKD